MTEPLVLDAPPGRVRLAPVVRFREFPFGTAADPSMRDAASPRPWEGQERALDYLRAGYVLARAMGADLADHFDPPRRANPPIGGVVVGGVTPMTDGTWVWPAGLIHFVAEYNVRLPQAFLDHAARHGWRVDRDRVGQGEYEFEL